MIMRHQMALRSVLHQYDNFIKEIDREYVSLWTQKITGNVGYVLWMLCVHGCGSWHCIYNKHKLDSSVICRNTVMTATDLLQRKPTFVLHYFISHYSKSTLMTTIIIIFYVPLHNNELHWAETLFLDSRWIKTLPCTCMLKWHSLGK